MTEPDNIVIFPYGEMDLGVLLRKAAHWDMDECVIVGLKDGQVVCGGTTDSVARVHWLCSLGAAWALHHVDVDRVP
jgi:hypothetical protein